MKPLLRCKKCKSYRYGVSLKEAKECIHSYNSFYYSLAGFLRAKHGKPLGLNDFELCECGTSYKEFVPYGDAHIFDNSIKPILLER